jgi:thiosulfate dehydrogenase (quinone) large subunit
VNSPAPDAAQPGTPRDRIAIALCRMATGGFFLLFGEYKLADSEFARHTFPEVWLKDFIASGAVGFYRAFLSGVVMPHHVFFGFLAGAVELFIGIALVAGLWVRVACVVGALYMINLTLATWWEPGHNLPVWRYFGAELDHLPLLLLFVVFFALDAGRAWGADGWRAARDSRS